MKKLMKLGRINLKWIKNYLNLMVILEHLYLTTLLINIIIMIMSFFNLYGLLNQSSYLLQNSPLDIYNKKYGNLTILGIVIFIVIFYLFRIKFLEPKLNKLIDLQDKIHISLSKLQSL